MDFTLFLFSMSGRISKNIYFDDFVLEKFFWQIFQIFSNCTPTKNFFINYFYLPIFTGNIFEEINFSPSST